MDIESLKAFVTIVESGSFTKASKHLFISQSAMSQKIKRLEDEFKKPLLIRSDGIKTTQYGDIVYNYGKEIIAKYTQMTSYLQDIRPTREIRFGLPDDFASLFMEDIVREYQKLNPDVFLLIECDLTLNLLDKFKNNGFDLVLLKLDSQESGTEVLKEELVWVGSKEFILDRTKPIPLIAAPKPCLYRSKATTALSLRHIKWEINFTSSSFTNLITAVSSGMGITVIPVGMVPKNCAIIRDDFLPKLSDMHVSIMKNDQNNPVLNYFETFLLKKLRMTL